MFELYITKLKSPADSVENEYLKVVSIPTYSCIVWFVLNVVISVIFGKLVLLNSSVVVPRTTFGNTS